MLLTIATAAVAGVGSLGGAAHVAQAAVGDELFKLTAADAAAGDEFGWSVAIDGNTAIVAARADDAGNGFGSGYLFDTTTGNQLAKLTADAAAGGNFGSSVAIDGNTAIVAAIGGNSFGSGYLFDTTTGNQLANLTADTALGDFFGWSVAIDGNTAIVGARGDSHAGTWSGSGYLFDTTTGNQLAKLTASDAAELDQFGWSVAIDGNTAIVGAPGGDDDAVINTGSAYLFDVTTGNQIFKLNADDAAFGDLFGWSVAISGNMAVVGALGGDDDASINTGSAYLFDTTTGNQLAKLTATDAAEGDLFGWSVAIDGTTVIVGARWDNDATGSAYRFDVTSGNQLAKLTATDAAEGDQFGWSVAISDKIALVGAPSNDDAGSDSGAAYLFSTVPEPSGAALLTLAFILCGVWRSSRRRPVR